MIVSDDLVTSTLALSTDTPFSVGRSDSRPPITSKEEANPRSASALEFQLPSLPSASVRYKASTCHAPRPSEESKVLVKIPGFESLLLIYT